VLTTRITSRFYRALGVLVLACLLTGCEGLGEDDAGSGNLSANRENRELYLQARALESQRRFPAAADAYRRFLKGSTSELLKTHAMIKTVVLEEGNRHGIDSNFDRFLRAVNERENGDWQTALTTLDHLIAESNGSYLMDDAVYLRGYILLVDQQNNRAADQQMADLIEQFPDSTYHNTALYSRGIAQKRLGNKTRATAHFQELQDRHSGLTLDIFNLRWPQDNFVSRLWFTRAHEQLVLLETDSLIGVQPGPALMAERDMDDRANIIVVFTDDQGYADLGASGIVTDVKSPNIDQLAADGIRMTSGYVTAPQCTPSRAGLLTGQYQQSFGLDDNRYTPLPLSQLTIANRLQDEGYSTGMVGKWHLEIDQNSVEYADQNPTRDQRIPYFPDQRGFDDVYFGYMNTWWTNFDMAGNTLPVNYRSNTDYRLDVATDAALAYIERHKQEPFFLYLSYYAPHVPMEATERYLSRHQNVPEVRRQHALAMISAIDDGVGRIRQNLQDNGLTDNTLIFFISDNGAPLGLHKIDSPITDHTEAWDGSLNEPWVGEKGMLSEGGIRVPYIVTWPENLPSGVVYDNAVSTLDVAATSLAAARVPVSEDLHGSNLLPHLKNEQFGLEERPLYWRFWSQAAIRKGSWKYLKAGDREFLYELNGNHETENLLQQYPQKANDLKQQLQNWTDTLYRPGLPDGRLGGQEARWYDFYLSEQ